MDQSITEALASSSPLFHRLQTINNIKPFEGGPMIIEERSCLDSDDAPAITGTGTSDSDTDRPTAAEFDVKQCVVPVTISGMELADRLGKQAIKDLIEQRVDFARSLLVDKLVEGAMGDGRDGKSMTGIQAMVAIDPDALVYGGIDPKQHPFWRNKVLKQNVRGASLVEDWDQLYSSLMRGKDHPDLILAGEAVFQQFVKEAEPESVDRQVAAAGFVNYKFRNADVVLDLSIPSNHAYFLTTNFIFFRQNEQIAVDIGGKTDAIIQYIMLYGNLTCSRRSAQGVYVGRR